MQYSLGNFEANNIIEADFSSWLFCIVCDDKINYYWTLWIGIWIFVIK